jgi:AraC family transcriptional regulator
MDGRGVFGERYEARIARAIAHVDDNPSQQISLEKLASIACLSPFHFHRIFRSLTGQPVREFVERRKLEQAIALANQGKSWKSASAACGFTSTVPIRLAPTEWSATAGKAAQERQAQKLSRLPHGMLTTHADIINPGPPASSRN